MQTLWLDGTIDSANFDTSKNMRRFQYVRDTRERLLAEISGARVIHHVGVLKSGT